MSYVRAKKQLGQHFLKDQNIARKIVSSLTFEGYDQVLEIGPGTGILTDILLSLENIRFKAYDVDHESVEYLHKTYPAHKNDILLQDFLKSDLNKLFEKGPFAVIGNFPYNISSQILFKVIDYKDLVPELVGMFQKEVAVRVAHGPGSKEYGAISVLLQAYYDIEYLFTVNEQVFHPPPKVKSAVIRMKRRADSPVKGDPAMFRQVVKTAFNQRRKTLRNSLKIMLSGKDISLPVFEKRPEQLSVSEFAELTTYIAE